MVYLLLAARRRHHSKVLGVLAVDSFGGCARASYDPQPEPGLKSFLEQMVPTLCLCLSVSLTHTHTLTTAKHSFTHSVA